MSSTNTFKNAARNLPPEDIHASFVALLGSALGLFVTGVGMVWYWQDLTSSGSVACQAFGSLLLAFAVSTHVGHLAKRIGRLGVTIATAGLYLWAASFLPFVFDRSRYAMLFWQHYFYFCWGLALALFALTSFIVLFRKEAREERDEEDPKTTIHISFAALLYAASGWLIFAMGYFAMAETPQGTRMGWILQTVGPVFIAIAITLHLEHASKHLGYSWVIFGIISGFVWALSALPFAINPNLLGNRTWGSALSNGLFALPDFLAAITLISIALKKRALEAAGARDEEFEGL